MANRLLKLKAEKALAQRRAFVYDKKKQQQKDPYYQAHLQKSEEDKHLLRRTMADGKVEVYIPPKKAQVPRKPRAHTKKVHLKSVLMNQAYDALQSQAREQPLPGRSVQSRHEWTERDIIQRNLGEKRREHAEEILDELELYNFVSLGATAEGEYRMYSRMEYERTGKKIGLRFYIVFIATTYIKRTLGYTSRERAQHIYLSGGKFAWMQLKQL